MSEIDLAFNSLEVLPSEAIHSKLLLEVPDALEEPLKIFSQNFFDEDVDALAKSKKLEKYFKTILRIPWKQGLTQGPSDRSNVKTRDTRILCLFRKCDGSRSQIRVSAVPRCFRVSTCKEKYDHPEGDSEEA